MGEPLSNGKYSAAEIMLESHEDRLQSVETELRENTRATVACTGKVESLSNQLVESHAGLLEKMNNGFERVFDKLEEHKTQAATTQAAVNSISEKVGAHQQDITTLKTEDLGRKQLRRRFKSLGWVGLVGSIGAMAGKAGDMLFHWLTHTSHY